MLAIALAAPVIAACDDPPNGWVAGSPAACITLPQGTGPAIVDTRTILYREARRVWRTGPVGTCPSLAPDRILIVEPGSQLCRNDRFRTPTYNTGIPSGYGRAMTPATAAAEIAQVARAGGI